jgi:DNA-binding beta-propeller fold protein YncE
MKFFRVALLAASLAVAAPGFSQAPKAGIRQITDPGVITTRQSITPAGVQSVMKGKIYGLAFAGSPDLLAVMTFDRTDPSQSGSLTLVDWRRSQIKRVEPVGGNAGIQGLVWDDVSKRLLLSGTRPGDRQDPKTASRIMEAVDGKIRVLADELGSYNAGSPGVARANDLQGRRLMALPLIADNKLAVFDLNSGRVIGSVKVPVAPFAAAITSDGRFAYVTNWGGRVPVDGDLNAPTGAAANADRVVIDSRGVLASGTVTKVNLDTLRVDKTLKSGLHPTALAIAPSSQRLYIANTNDDAVSVIDTATDQIVGTWTLQPFDRPVFGLAPSALLVSPDVSTVYVACGGINAVLVLDGANGKIRGMIPTGWYPNGLALSPDGRYLAVSTLLGVGSGWQEKPDNRFVHSYRGTVHVIPIPDDAQLLNHTLAVAENNRMALPGAAAAEAPRAGVPPRAIPLRPGEPSLIEHVVYIIKENRTYDQLLGDLDNGNGEPSFVIYGEGIADNHRKLAREFVLLDNFYASGGNSGDGHQWATQANETAYVLWPAYQGRSYPFDGNDPIAYSRSGFIWDATLRKGKSVMVYGEFAPRMLTPGPEERSRLLEEWKQGRDFHGVWKPDPQLPDLRKVFAMHFPAYTNAIPDAIRADIFLKDLRAWTQRGSMPNLTIIQLPCDHTYGVRPGISTPQAMVADNDLALGRIVEGLSRSPFWKKMAIFVVEDDAQGGVDHVDGHRTVALAAGPYVRRATTDSTFYAHQSILKTIELILGLEPMTIFDRIANDMRNSFTDRPDLTPYTSVRPRQDLFARAPVLDGLLGKAREAALACERMRWDVPDAVPSDQLNRILWHDAKGWDVPFPGVRQSLFAPLSADLDDDDR